ncbi:MAG TPA: hypothetical protein VGX78_12430 [Pirellulales bacterium]|nr:hypothetical protein [Pirellulales bacterium]
MSIGPLSNIAAGTPLAQAQGSDLVRSAKEVADQARQVETGRKAASAAGIGAAQGEGNETSDRDVDGRLPWGAPADHAPSTDQTAGLAPDPTGQNGTQLDLAG